MASIPNATEATGRERPLAKTESADRIGRSIASIAGIIGLFVTLNTLLTNCSKDSIDRATGFRTAVAAEEKYWTDLYVRYVNAVSNNNADMEKRRLDLLAIAFLTVHQNPDFSDYRNWYDGGKRVKAADVMLSNMRQSLRGELTDPRNSNDEIAREIDFFLAQKTVVRTRAPGDDRESLAPPEVTEAAQAATQAAVQAQTAEMAVASSKPNYGSHILGTGPSTGWDVDVFWCEGGATEVGNFARASSIGQALAGAATSGASIIPGMNLGRVRLRSLPLAQQESGGFFTGGDGVVSDGGAGEKDAAQALGAFITRKTKFPLRQVTSVGAITNWYLSVFVCQPKPTAPRAVPEASGAQAN